MIKITIALVVSLIVWFAIYMFCLGSLPHGEAGFSAYAFEKYRTIITVTALASSIFTFYLTVKLLKRLAVYGE